MTRPSPVHRRGPSQVSTVEDGGRYGPAVIKLVFCLTRKDGMSRQEFQRYWREDHAPLVASHAETLNIRRYHQLHTVDDAINDPIRASRGGPPSYDGVAELWWDSLETLAAPGQTEAGRAAGAALLEDEKRFIDLSRSPLFFTEVHEVVDR
jgi:uncharacterized protein (TIGR02118 family)